MYRHTVAYSASHAAVTNTVTAAATDGVLAVRNSGIILTEDFNLLAAYGSSTTLTRGRFGNAALQQKSIPHIWPLGRTDTIPSRPRLMDMRDRPMALPQNEAITIESTTDAAGPVIANYILHLAKPAWHRNFPAFLERLNVRATVVIAAGSASSWGTPVELVFERDPLNGVYAVVGAAVVAANAIAFRIRFPDQPNADLKQLRPGGLCTNALGDFPYEADFGGWGEWGRFHTFSPPEIQLFEDTAGGTYEVRLDLLYLGQSESLLSAPR